MIKSRVADVLDKRKFCQFIIENEVFDEQGEILCRSQFVVLFLGSGGIGNRGKSDIQVIFYVLFFYFFIKKYLYVYFNFEHLGEVCKKHKTYCE